MLTDDQFDDLTELMEIIDDIETDNDTNYEGEDIG